MVNIFLSTFDIEEPWVVAQCMAEALSKKALTIYNSTDINLLSIFTDNYQKERFKRYVSGKRKGLTVYRGTDLFVNYGGIEINLGNRMIDWVEKQALKKIDRLRNGFLKEIDESEIIYWCITAPFYSKIKKKYPKSKFIYYLVDDILEYRDSKKKQVSKSLENTLTVSDHVFVVSKELQRKISLVRNDVKLLYLGSPLKVKDISLDENFIRDNNFKIEKKKKTIGMVGTFSNIIEFGTLYHLAINLKDYNFEFVGNIENDLGKDYDKLMKLENVKHHGIIPYNEVLNFVSKLDVCLLPFVQNKLTKSADPSKIYEYLSLGKPVIATPINADIYRFSDIIYIRDKSEFLNTINDIHNTETKEKFLKRINFMKNNTWQEVIENFLKQTTNSNFLGEEIH